MKEIEALAKYMLVPFQGDLDTVAVVLTRKIISAIFEERARCPATLIDLAMESKYLRNKYVALHRVSPFFINRT